MKQKLFGDMFQRQEKAIEQVNGFYTQVRAHLFKIKGERVRICLKVNLSKLC